MHAAANVKLEASWKAALQDEFDKPYMRALGEFLRAQKVAGKVIFPPGPLIFNALNSTPLEQVKVVIIGQDPYHGPGQAHGAAGIFEGVGNQFGGALQAHKFRRFVGIVVIGQHMHMQISCRH